MTRPADKAKPERGSSALCSDGRPGHYEDNQGRCHTCGTVVNQAQYDAYMAGAWT